MKQIIEKITIESNVDFTEEESTWFNGNMNVPVKTYRFVYPSLLGDINVIGEYRRNTWLKANWYKDIHFTDIYHWTIKLNAKVTLPSLEIRAHSWIQRKLFNRPRLMVNCRNKQLRRQLENSPEILELLIGGQENIGATIRTDDKVLWTTYNTIIDHEGLIRKGLRAFQVIQEKIKTTANIGYKTYGGNVNQNNS